MQQVEITSFDFQYKDGRLEVRIDGQPVNLRLLQKVEVVLDANLSVPFVRLTMLAGDTGVRLGSATLEVKAGDPGRHTFGAVSKGRAHQPELEPADTHEYDPNHGHHGVGTESAGHQP